MSSTPDLLLDNKIQPEAILNRAHKLREKTSDYMVTDDEFTQAKVAGRR